MEGDYKEMKKIPTRIIFLSIFGLLIAFMNFIFSNVHQPIFIIVTVVYLFLSMGLLFLINWIRLLTIYFSIFNILEYVMLLTLGIIGLNKGGKNIFLAIGFIFHFPGLIFSILALHYLNMKRIKEKFIKRN